MTENELTMTMDFDQNNFFIMSPNPTVAAKIVGSIQLHIFDGTKNLQMSHHMADIHDNSSRMLPTSYSREH